MNPIRILRAATLALIAGAALTACTIGVERGDGDLPGC